MYGVLKIPAQKILDIPQETVHTGEKNNQLEKES